MNNDNIEQGKIEITKLIENIHKEKKREMVVFSVMATVISLLAAYFAGALAFFICASLFFCSYFILFRLASNGAENMRCGLLSVMYASANLSKTKSKNDSNEML